MLDLLCFQWRDLGSRELEKLKLCMCPIKKSSKSNIFEGKGTSQEKNGQTKKHKFHEMPDLLCFQRQNPQWRGAHEKETLHVPNELFSLCLCQKSSKSNIFLGKRASEAKSGETKKPKFHEMLDLLCFRWQNLESRGAEENETLHVANQLLPLYVCQISSKSNQF